MIIEVPQSLMEIRSGSLTAPPSSLWWGWGLRGLQVRAGGQRAFVGLRPEPGDSGSPG